MCLNKQQAIRRTSILNSACLSGMYLSVHPPYDKIPLAFTHTAVLSELTSCCTVKSPVDAPDALVKAFISIKVME